MRFVIYIFSFFLVFRPVFPVVHYIIDYDYIATVLCINKDKLELKCNGRCYLMKEMANAEKDKPIDKDIIQLAFTVLFFQHGEQATIAQIETRIREVFSVYLNSYRQLFAAQIFRPPLANSSLL